MHGQKNIKKCNAESIDLFQITNLMHTSFIL